MKPGIRTKLVLAFEFILVIPVLVMLAVGSSESGIENAFALIISQSALLIAGTAIVSSIIVRSVLKPLEELHKATEKIMAGDLDNEIGYKKNDEMGRYCQAFDQLRVQLKESLEKQAALERSRRELIASISHDLRTPLASIRGYVEGLDDGIVHDADKYHRYITVIKNKTESLNNLIENLFKYSQLDISDRKENLCVCNSNDLLEAIVKPIEIEFKDQAIKLEVMRPFPSVRLYANEGSITQVFDNLISNARRYVGNGGLIKIEARTENNRLEIFVTDNGTGISQDDLPHVFDQFYRSEKSRSRNYGGAGLGLAICKKIIEDHGGKIWVESTPNISTKFMIVLPIISCDSTRSLDDIRHSDG